MSIQLKGNGLNHLLAKRVHKLEWIFFSPYTWKLDYWWPIHKTEVKCANLQHFGFKAEIACGSPHQTRNIWALKACLGKCYVWQNWCLHSQKRCFLFTEKISGSRPKSMILQCLCEDRKAGLDPPSVVDYIKRVQVNCHWTFTFLFHSYV